MTIIEITRPAKCKDCKWIEQTNKGKRKYHKCSNPESKNYNSQITLNDLACDKWSLI